MKKGTIYTTLVMAHLIVVLYGAVRTPFISNVPGFRQTMGVYGAYTGADNAYGFFAPSVSSQARARVVWTDDTGVELTSIIRSKSHEGSLRYDTIMSLAASANSSIRREIASSLAAAALAERPANRSVTIMLDALIIPTMAEFRLGSRPRWTTIYTASFSI